jgi:putative transposase
MSYIKIWIHAVWGTKNRQPVLKPSILQQVCIHILKNAKEKDIFIDRINGYDEHIHVLMLLKHDNSIAKQMQLLKGESAYWINKHHIIKGGLDWADKYSAASVSEDKLEIVRAYISNQQHHHRNISFSEEYSHFLKKMGYQEDFG